MHRYPTPHTWMHQNRHSSRQWLDILPLTHEGTKIIIPQVNAPESYPSHMNAPKSSLLTQMHRNPTPHTWMYRNHHPFSKCTGILTITHECTDIVIPKVNAPKSYASNMNAPKSSSLDKCTRFLPLTPESNEIVTPKVNAPESYPSHMKASKSSSLKRMH